MAPITFPHTFHDGVSETASGVQVMDNLNALKTAIEALEAALPIGLGQVASAETPRALNTAYTPNASRATQVTLEVAFNTNALGANFLRVPATFIVPAGQTWKITEPAAGVVAVQIGSGGGFQFGPGGTSVKEVLSSYLTL